MRMAARGADQPEWRLRLVRISMSRRSAYRASVHVLRIAAVKRVIFEVRSVDREGVVCDMVDQILQ